MNLTLLLSYGLLAMAQIAIGVNVVAGKFLISNIPTHVYLCGRFIVSAFFLLILVWILREPIVIKRDHLLNKKDWFYLTMQAFSGGFLFNVMFYWGIQFTTAISAGIISSVLPVMIALCACWFLGESLSKWKYIGISFAAIGIVVISLDNNYHHAGISGSHLGDFVILLSMVPEALYSIFNKFTNHKVTPLGGALIVNTMIAFMLLPFGAVEFFMNDLTQIAMSHWWLLFITGFASLFFFWFWSRGLLHVQASTAALFTSFLPLSTTLMAWAFLNEKFGLYDGIGMIFVLLSIGIGTGWLPTLFAKNRKKTLSASS